MKQISVIMAVYNEPAEWLDGSIGSILTQTFKEFEFIIINDNPDRDELRAILKRYSESDGRIRIIENEQNIGLAKSLNEGLKKAKGKYIARMDSDDISLPERLEMQHRFLEKHTDIFLTGCSAQIMDRNGKLREKAIKEGLHEDIVKAMLAGKLAFYHPTIMFRNEGFLYREKLDGVEDYDLYLGLLHNGKKFGNIQETVFCYRMSGQSVSITKKRRQVILRKTALKLYYERAQSGYDSYDKLDFNDEEQLLKFTGIPLATLEAEALREQIVFALGAGDHAFARRAFERFKAYDAAKTEKLTLWLFLTIPCTYKLYRKLRYEIF